MIAFKRLDAVSGKCRDCEYKRVCVCRCPCYVVVKKGRKKNVDPRIK